MKKLGLAFGAAAVLVVLAGCATDGGYYGGGYGYNNGYNGGYGYGYGYGGYRDYDDHRRDHHRYDRGRNDYRR